MTFSIYRETLSSEMAKGFLYRFAILFLFLAVLTTLGYSVYIFKNQKIETIIIDTSQSRTKLSDYERMEQLAGHLLSLVTYITPSNCDQRANRYLTFVPPETYTKAFLELKETCSYLDRSRISIVYSFEDKPAESKIDGNSVTFIYNGTYMVIGAAKQISEEKKKFSVKLSKRKGEIYADTIKVYDPDSNN